MTFFFITTLGISIAGMSGLVLLKRSELRSGQVLLGGLRAKAGALLHICTQWVEEVLPELARQWIARGIELSRHVARAGIARTLLFVESALEWVLHFVRSSTTPVETRPPGEVSAFLREVAEHKKKILRRTRPKQNLE